MTYFRREYDDLGTGSGGSGLLAGLCRGRCLAAALCFGRRCRRFANDFSRQETRHEQLGTVIIEIYRSALGIGGKYDPHPEYFVLDGLAFLHYLHNVLLNNNRSLLALNSLSF
jgi:hypothetical protein